MVKCNQNHEKRQRVQNELARNGERASWRMNHVCTQSQSRASARSELSASLGPVPGKSNYSKRDRKLLRSRSSLSIYTVCSDQGVGVEMYRGLAIPLPLLILLVDVQGMAEYTLEPHVRFPLFSDLTVLFVFSCSTYASPTFLLSLYLFHAKFGWCSCVREYEPFVSCIRKHADGDIADSFWKHREIDFFLDLDCYLGKLF